MAVLAGARRARPSSNWDLALNPVAVHTGVGSPMDVVQYRLNGVDGLLVSDIASDALHFFDPANPSSPMVFIDSDGVTGFDIPHQINLDASTGNIRVTSWTSPEGFWEYDKATGAQLDHVDTQALFGHRYLEAAYQLGNGQILYSHRSALRVYDPLTATSVSIMDNVRVRFINALAGTGFGYFCDPANPNSTGGEVFMYGHFAGGALHLDAGGGPTGEFGYFLVGNGAEVTNPLQISNGLLCLATSAGHAIGRYNVAGGALNSLGLFDGAGGFQNVSGTSTTGVGFDVPARFAPARFAEHHGWGHLALSALVPGLPGGVWAIQLLEWFDGPLLVDVGSGDFEDDFSVTGLEVEVHQPALVFQGEEAWVGQLADDLVPVAPWVPMDRMG